MLRNIEPSASCPNILFMLFPFFFNRYTYDFHEFKNSLRGFYVVCVYDHSSSLVYKRTIILDLERNISYITMFISRYDVQPWRALVLWSLNDLNLQKFCSRCGRRKVKLGREFSCFVRTNAGATIVSRWIFHNRFLQQLHLRIRINTYCPLLANDSSIEIAQW